MTGKRFPIFPTFPVFPDLNEPWTIILLLCGINDLQPFCEPCVVHTCHPSLSQSCSGRGDRPWAPPLLESLSSRTYPELWCLSWKIQCTQTTMNFLAKRSVTAFCRYFDSKLYLSASNHIHISKQEAVQLKAITWPKKKSIISYCNNAWTAFQRLLFVSLLNV